MTRPPILGAALLCLAAAGCCVAPPDSDDWMSVGWRTPTQAFETFQTAIRADSAELEYRSFSVGFRERNQISKLAWREARAELRKRYPFLRKGLADARLVAPPVVSGARAHAEAESHGRRIRLEFVREDFAELWAQDELVSDAFVEFGEVTFVQKGSDDRRWFQGSVALPAGDETGSTITDIHIGREWKLDSFETLEPAPSTTSPREASSPRAESLD